jgi:hypothetical protein
LGDRRLNGTSTIWLAGVRSKKRRRDAKEIKKTRPDADRTRRGMNKIINVQLIANPFNWLTVWLMVILMSIFGHFVLTWAGVSHTPNSDKPAQA